ncbi:hypothetical protein [Agromyces marinus]|uniref:Integral membrane protein n=1 Tax=Agromyces marinus TaxID=1389020 RepID=A0ABM8GYM3_9MICO|nr:hypothetical protein [Agromyces marinus]UIP58210.1 hypothetical protein DSM26151_10810 [Agromyces marinus]BDZ53548.1 hypothetical protein GCM10025870_06210 [Agromyces marinus]
MEPSEPESSAEPDETGPRPIRWWLCLPIGAAAAALGLLPWVLSGMRLPLQNLWATDTPPESYPLVLLPFSQYALSIIAALLIVGSAFAGVAARATRPVRRRPGTAWMLLGLLAVQVFAIAQTATVVRDGLEERPESTLYLAALVGIATLAVFVGLVVMLLVAAAPPGGAVIGLAITAVLTPGWVRLLLIHDLFPVVDPASAQVLDLLRWLPAVLVGAAIAWAGVASVGRVLGALVALAVLWIGPALITAVSNAASSRVLARDPVEMLDYAGDVFRAAVTDPSLALPPIIVAVVVAVLGLLGKLIVGRLGREQAEPAAG